jgi:hypothetical protein
LRKFLYQTLFPTNNHIVRHQLGVIIFGSVWFLEKKETKPKLKKQLKPVQTDRFWLGSVF